MTNKKILFIAPSFFGYADLIKNRLLLNGAKVDFYYDLPNSKIDKIMLQFPILKNKLINKYYSNINSNLDDFYDYIFIIKGIVIPSWFYKSIKLRYTNGYFIQYHWDDIDLYPEIKRTFQYFDRILSYNILDSEKYNFTLRPFFYDEMTEIKTNLSKEYDLFFIGSYSKPRMEFILNFLRNIDSIRLKYKKHFYIHIITFIKDRISIKYAKLFNYNKISYKDMMHYLTISKTSLDVPYKPQQGLTTRIFEALYTKTKIITTNKNISKYDFYNPNNYYIIDYNNPMIDYEWLDLPYKEYPENILIKYTLQEWINEIFNI